MLRRLRACDLYIFLWVIYYLQGIIYPSGIINVLVQMVMLLWALIVVVRYINIFKKSPICRATIVLIIMYSIYGLHNIMFAPDVYLSLGGAPSKHGYLQSSLNSLLPILLFYHYTYRGFLSSKRIVLYLFIFIVISLITYYNYQQKALLTVEGDEITNNTGYWFAYLVPLVLFLKNRKLLQYLILAIILFFTITGMKRGAILIVVMSIIIFIYYDFRSASAIKKLMVLLLVLALSYFSFSLVESLLSTNAYFVSRMEQTIQGESSGRNLLYSSIWNGFCAETNLFKLLFGHGANQTIALAGNYAHNDWLETIYNNGIVGAMLLLLFYMKLAKSVLKLRSVEDKGMFASFLILASSSFAASIFSMSIQSLLIYQSMMLGYFAYRVSISQNENGVTVSNCTHC